MTSTTPTDETGKSQSTPFVPWRMVAAAGAVALGLLAAAILSSCSTASTPTAIAPPHVPGAHFVGNQTCADCHTNIARVFPMSPHARFYREGDLARAAMAGCESCHGAGSEHVRVGGGGGKFIVNPGRDPSACLQCHLETHAEFNLPYRHPVLESHMNCVQCHDPHGHDIRKAAGGLAMARLNDSCAGCHREQVRPFVFEHEAMREGCLTCHSPHGSVNPKLLVERDVNLCLKCHAQVQTQTGQVIIGKEDHTLYLQAGACFSAGCHAAVHGSNISPKLRY
jgi:predicted CXXCH cytochrome family protein